MRPAFSQVLPPEAHEAGAVAPGLAAEAVARVVQPLAVVDGAAPEAEAPHAFQAHGLRLPGICLYKEAVELRP